ncbi:MAG: redox-sensing transcriptional repressor Rex [Candidatus Eremiobacteraeota bacterium]|nr:redox-sensing transcriptional repressor Rex [Candidatus Eremiobacteraeota bacterium]
MKTSPRKAKKLKAGSNGRSSAPAPQVISIPRLFLYHRGLEDALRAGDKVVTSQELAARIGRGMSSTQIRKDLSYLGSFGRRGRGYDVVVLVKKLARVLGLDRDWRIAIVGFGNLGHALATFLEFREEKFHIAAIFEADPHLIGSTWHGVSIRDVGELETVLPALDCGIGIIAVPAGAAQRVAERLVAAGVGALLNFAPTNLALAPTVAVRTIDLASELSILTHHLS